MTIPRLRRQDNLIIQMSEEYDEWKHIIKKNEVNMCKPEMTRQSCCWTGVHLLMIYYFGQTQNSFYFLKNGQLPWTCVPQLPAHTSAKIKEKLIPFQSTSPSKG